MDGQQIDRWSDKDSQVSLGGGHPWKSLRRKQRELSAAQEKLYEEANAWGSSKEDKKNSELAKSNNNNLKTECGVVERPTARIIGDTEQFRSGWDMKSSAFVGPGLAGSWKEATFSRLLACPVLSLYMQLGGLFHEYFPSIRTEDLITFFNSLSASLQQNLIIFNDSLEVFGRAAGSRRYYIY